MMSRNSAVLAPEKPAVRSGPVSSDAAWRLAAWVGAALAVVGLADILLVLYPWSLGQPAWEFGVMDAAVSTLPLLLVGWTMMVAAAMVRRRSRLLTALGVFAVVAGLAVAGGFLLYLLSAPFALRMAPAEVLTGIHKSIARVTIMSLVFGSSLVFGGVAALRSRK
jgi:hypothetical protein